MMHSAAATGKEGVFTGYQAAGFSLHTVGLTSLGHTFVVRLLASVLGKYHVAALQLPGDQQYTRVYVLMSKDNCHAVPIAIVAVVCQQ